MTPISMAGFHPFSPSNRPSYRNKGREILAFQIPIPGKLQIRPWNSRSNNSNAQIGRRERRFQDKLIHPIDLIAIYQLQQPTKRPKREPPRPPRSQTERPNPPSISSQELFFPTPNRISKSFPALSLTQPPKLSLIQHLSLPLKLPQNLLLKQFSRSLLDQLPRPALKPPLHPNRAQNRPPIYPQIDPQTRPSIGPYTPLRHPRRFIERPWLLLEGTFRLFERNLNRLLVPFTALR